MPYICKTKKSKYNKDYYQTHGKFKEAIKRLEAKQKREYENRVINTTSSYRQSITDHYSQFDHNHYFTGTVNPMASSKFVKDMNKKVKEYNDALPLDCIQFALPQYRANMNIHKLKSYTDKFIAYLLHLNLIERAIVFFEQAQNKSFHVHITMKLTDFSLPTNIESTWLLGISQCKPIPQHEVPVKIWYSTKELSLTSGKVSDLDKSQYWFPHGSYDKSTLPVNTKQIQNQNKVLQVLKDFRVQKQLKQFSPSVTNTHKTLALC